MTNQEISLTPSHLNEALVALDGSLIVSGSIDHPADDEGQFSCLRANLLRISRVEGFRIVRCRSSRDRSGFLQAEEYGSELHVPAPLAAIIERAFCFGVKEPWQATLGHQDGVLTSSTNRIKTLMQPLSDWTLRVHEENGTIRVDLSALLYGTVISDSPTSTANYWRAEHPSRINVRFRVDPITRVACFSAYIPSLEQGVETPATIPVNSGLTGLDLATAPVGALAQFAVSGKRWYSINEGVRQQKSLVLTEHGIPARNSVGLLNDSRYYRWPRISIQGLDMKTIAAMLGRTSRVRLAIAGDMLGEAYWSYGSGGSKTTNINDLQLDVQMDSPGLCIRVSGTTESTDIRLNVILSWELLILRFPFFTRLEHVQQAGIFRRVS